QRPASGAESVFSLDPPVSEVVKAATPWNDKTLERALAAVEAQRSSHKAARKRSSPKRQRV
ncbi:MAG: hypothetical protein LBW85_03915, partial [Deltaproteobacteria bacterium]|nr:hypothetical protein [Deltaproteobacteria bacterium]